MRFLKFLPGIVLVLFLLVVFKPFFVNGLLPIPADTIVGLYHPWRDLYAKDYPNGIPMKNTLITDAVRQGYVWRDLAISQIKNGQLPVWNPYSFSGYPLLANFQSAPFYPLNFVYWLTNFSTGWSSQVLAQILLGGIFMWMFLKNLKLRDEAVALGVLAWVGSGFFVSWMETNVVIQAAIWLPFALFSVDKRKGWLLTFVLACSLLAGHAQIFGYVLLTTVFYIFYRRYWVGLVSILIAFILTVFWWLPAANFILLSARNVDQIVWQKPDWFLPWQNLSQLIAPDYLGNPATGNYFGVWNYGEFVGYIGIGGILFVMVGQFAKLKQSKFFVWLLIFSLLFALPTVISSLPFVLNIPFISSFQPSRLIFLIDFSLATLAAFGLDWFISNGKKKPLILSTVILFISFVFLYIIAFKLNLDISLRNLYLPSILLILVTGLVFIKNKSIVVILILLLMVFDLSRFSGKFLSFSKQEYLFPKTQITEFIKNNAGDFRVAAIDERIMPGNFSVAYNLQSAGGYDPLYLRRYGEFIIALERNKPDISAPFGFNRIITPKNYDSRFFDLLGVKYVLSLDDINSPKYKKVFQEGQTKVYENTKVLPRAFFVQTVQKSTDKQTTIKKMFEDVDLSKTLIVENYNGNENFNKGEVKISSYSPNDITLETKNDKEGFLLLTDIYYPSWKAEIDGKETKIYLSDYTFRGIVVPEGKHTVRFFVNLW